ncbi:hypothetical protein MKZ38_004526 [Zalerion maritima]|uniref:Cytochrome c oxidase subunit IV n=1 Tax=Zalerion maritima TaxID=339359 RepID=A0AAD5RMF7_9PEZI|nr:hypothetical protein MKZ38_004526 [Zalerion maritima]
MFRTPATRLVAGATRTTTISPIVRSTQLRVASTAISNPTLNNIEKRWEGMPVQEQAELWMSLRDRMKSPWQELTLNEKKAELGCGHAELGTSSQRFPTSIQAGDIKTNSNPLTFTAYWIAFGPHGPRAEPPPGEGKRVFLGTAVGVLVSVAIFMTVRMFGSPAPSTMTKEYQEESNEFLKAQKAEPFTGIGRADYKGPGMVQSAPKGPE